MAHVDATGKYWRQADNRDDYRPVISQRATSAKATDSLLDSRESDKGWNLL